LTSAWTKTIGGTSWSKNYSYYDEKGSVIYVYEKNYLGGYTQNKSLLDFRGKIETSITEHKRESSDQALVIKDYFTYDHVERPLSHTQSIGGPADLVDSIIVLDDTSPTSDQTSIHIASESITLTEFTALPGFQASIEPDDRELISYNVYNELGQLISKKIGGEANSTIATSTGLQTIDYTYNIRGWLTKMNDVDTMGNDLFSYEMNYESGEGTASVNNVYNGNIKQVIWRSANNNIKKSYAFQYDKLNRFSSSHFRENDALTGGAGKFESYDINYDANGNITKLMRKDQLTQVMDNLTYTYDDGNKLMSINDFVNVTFGFNDGPTWGSASTNYDYDYDNNGNLTKDLNKNITNISYNHLDLVKKVTFSNGSKIEFTYDANGSKLQMKSTVFSGAVTTVDYLGGFQYKNTQLQFFPTPEGYVNFNGGSFEYVYQYKDHLGNIRLSYSDPSGNYQEILDSDFTNDYDGWVNTGGVTSQLENGRIKVNVDNSWEGIMHHFDGGLDVSPGETYTIRLTFDKGNTVAKNRILIQELDVNGNHLS